MKMHYEARGGQHNEIIIRENWEELAAVLFITPTPRPRFPLVMGSWQVRRRHSPSARAAITFARLRANYPYANPGDIDAMMRSRGYLEGAR